MPVVSAAAKALAAALPSAPFCKMVATGVPAHVNSAAAVWPECKGVSRATSAIDEL